jgi:hypothetical protein
MEPHILVIVGYKIAVNNPVEDGVSIRMVMFEMTFDFRFISKINHQPAGHNKKAKILFTHNPLFYSRSNLVDRLYS